MAELYDPREIITNDVLKKEDKNAMEVFNGVTGFSGFYSPSMGGDVAILFSRAADEGAGAPEVNTGFLASGYQVQWQRGVTVQRVLNRTAPVAIVGTGTGTLSISGLIGTYEGFQELTGHTSSADLCNPIIARIAAGTGFTACDDKGKTIDNTTGIQLILSNLIMNSIQVSGQYNEQGTLMQQANVSFTIGGFKLAKADMSMMDKKDPVGYFATNDLRPIPKA